MLIKFLKPLSFLPAIFIMYMIFSFSAQNGETSAALSYKISYKIVEVGGDVLGADLQPWEIEQLAERFHTPVRKLAHMTEYFLLAVAVAFPLYVYGLRGILLLFVTAVVCVAFACSDEYHQAYVAGRGPSKKDVLIDSVGVLFGTVLVRIIGWTGRNTFFRPSTRKKNRRRDDEPYMQTPPYMQQPQQAPSRRQPLQGGADYYRQPQQGGADYYRQPPQGESDYYRQSTQGGSDYYRQSPQDGADYYRQPLQGEPDYYRQPPYPPYESGAPDYYAYDEYEDEEPIATSDRLSEDMSFRKLVSDLKEQKQARNDARKNKIDAD